MVASAVDEGWTLERRQRFLGELARRANVRSAARAVGMTEASVFELRRRSPAFRRQWEGALDEAYARLEVELLDRATNGTVKPVFHGGQKIGSVVEYPDRLALALMDERKGRRSAAKSVAAAGDAGAKSRLAAKLQQMNRRLTGQG